MSDVNYYKINEDAARRAKEMNSFSDYKAGSATAGYRQMVDKAAGIAAAQKRRVDPMYTYVSCNYEYPEKRFILCAQTCGEHE